jgi:hypothetical protein
MSDTLTPARLPERISLEAGLGVVAAAYSLPATIFFIIGLQIGNLITGAGFAILWFGFLTNRSWCQTAGRAFAAVSRLDLPCKVLSSGPGFLLWIIDRLHLIGTHAARPIDLFGTNDSLVAIDFTDGVRSPIRGTAWYQIGDPEALGQGDKERVEFDVLRHAYLINPNDRQRRIREIFETVVRGLLEMTTSADAQARMEEIMRQSVEISRDALRYFGVYPAPNKPITVEGLDIPPAVQEIRMRPLRGRMDAEEAKNRAPVYSVALMHMIEELAKAGVDMTTSEAVNVLLSQQGLEAIRHTDGTINIVASGTSDIIKTFVVGGAATSGRTP